MDDKNGSNVQHPLDAVLIMFRTAFATAAAFWRPWLREPEKRDVAVKEQLRVVSEETPEPTKREEKATEKKPKAPITRPPPPKPLTQEAAMEKKPKAPITRAQRQRPSTQEAAMEKKPKAPIKRSLKDEQELEREELVQKTERLRELRLAKEAADREKHPSSLSRDQPQTTTKK